MCVLIGFSEERALPWNAEPDEDAQLRAQRIAYAEDELNFLLKQSGIEPPQVHFQINTALKDYAFSYVRNSSGLVFAAKSGAGVVQAVYAALECAGMRFEIDGPVLETSLDFGRIPSEPVLVEPAVKLRGIRQHINFCMDVSGYPLGEAKEYIHNLARMGYNFMAFHSYPGQWTRDRLDHQAVFYDYKTWVREAGATDDTILSGAFFYGEDIPIPPMPEISSRIRFNEKYFCIPTVEPTVHTLYERGAETRAWLRALMKECRRAGMRVQLSTELRSGVESYNLELANRIIEDYPEIDNLEFITREAGGAETIPPDVYSRQREFFPSVLETEDAEAVYQKYFKPWKGLNKDGLLPQTLDFAYAVRTACYLQSIGWDRKHGVQLGVGAYAVRRDTTKLIADLAEQHVPADIQMSFMPSHGARGVADNLPPMSRELARRTVVYSWLEFDGYMMQQQYAARGLYDLVGKLEAATGGAVYAVACNHWRTAPNAPAFRYFAEVSKHAGISPNRFTQELAQRWGLNTSGHNGTLSSVLAEIEALSEQTAIAPNIGFVVTHNWLINPERRSIGHFNWWSLDKIKSAIRRYQKVLEQIRKLKTDAANESGREALSRLETGVQLSLWHVQAVALLQEAVLPGWDASAKRMKDPLPETVRAGIVSRCDEAQRLIRRYLDLLGRNLYDRGEEGMLLSYYWCMVPFANNIKALYGGEGEFIDTYAGTDPVPLPLDDESASKAGHGDGPQSDEIIAEKPVEVLQDAVIDRMSGRSIGNASGLWPQKDRSGVLLQFAVSPEMLEAGNVCRLQLLNAQAALQNQLVTVRVLDPQNNGWQENAATWTRAAPGHLWRGPDGDAAVLQDALLPGVAGKLSVGPAVGWGKKIEVVLNVPLLHEGLSDEHRITLWVETSAAVDQGPIGFFSKEHAGAVAEPGKLLFGPVQ